VNGLLAPSSNNRSGPNRLRWLALMLSATLLVACSTSGPVRDEGEVSARSTEATGVSQRRSRKSRRAAQALDEPTALNIPAQAHVSYQRAVDAMAREDWVEAELELEQLLLEYTTYAGPYINLAIVYMQDARTAEAQAALEQALALDPAHAVANNHLGILLRGEGKFDAAEQAYRRAIASNPQYWLPYYNLGVLLDLYLRRPAEALNYYQQYQDSLAEPDQRVALWIIDLQRRLRVSENAARVAQEDTP